MMHGMHGFTDSEATLPSGPIAAGEKLDLSKFKLADESAVIEALKTVFDPEIPVDIWELGLIYEMDIQLDGDCKILMTLTAPGCPVAGQLVSDVAAAVSGVEGIGVCTVELTWDPPWTMERMSEEARLLLDMF